MDRAAAYHAPLAAPRPERPGSGAIAIVLRALGRELSGLLYAISHPNKIIAEVEEMHALHCAANDLEQSDPARAAKLRAQAASIGL